MLGVNKKSPSGLYWEINLASLFFVFKNLTNFTQTHKTAWYPIIKGLVTFEFEWELPRISQP